MKLKQLLFWEDMIYWLKKKTSHLVIVVVKKWRMSKEETEKGNSHQLSIARIEDAKLIVLFAVETFFYILYFLSDIVTINQ